MSRKQIQEEHKRKKSKRIGQGKLGQVEKWWDKLLQEKREADPTAWASEVSWRIWVLPVDNCADLLSCSLLPC